MTRYSKTIVCFKFAANMSPPFPSPCERKEENKTKPLTTCLVGNTSLCFFFNVIISLITWTWRTNAPTALSSSCFVSTHVAWFLGTGCFLTKCTEIVWSTDHYPHEKLVLHSIIVSLCFRFCCLLECWLCSCLFLWICTDLFLIFRQGPMGDIAHCWYQPSAM